MATVFIDFDEAKRVISIPMVMEAAGIDMSQYPEKNGRMRGICPLPTHPESDYRNQGQFVADAKKFDYWMFRCFGDCSCSGDSLDLAKRLTGLDNSHIRYWLDEHFGSLLAAKPARPTTAREENKAAEAPPKSQEEVVKPPTVSPLPLKPLRWRYTLNADCPYLTEQRGLSDQTINRFQIGECTTGKMMVGRIAIPIWLPDQTEKGNPSAYLGRAIEETLEPRYLFPDGFPRNDVIYNLGPAVRDSSEGSPLVIVEGCFKVFDLYEKLGLTNVVATLGSSLGEGQAQQLIATGRPLALFWDGDARDKARKACGQLIKHAFVRVITLDDDVEPDHLPGDELRDLLSFMLLPDGYKP